MTNLEKVIRQKAQRFVNAERQYWKRRYALEKRYRQDAEIFELAEKITIPENLSSVVWALKDGLAFVRYKSWKGQEGAVELRCFPNLDLTEWGTMGLTVPTKDGDISLAKAGIPALSPVKIINSTFNGVIIEYVEITYVFYGTEKISEPLQMAISDFQLSLLGMGVLGASQGYDQSRVKTKDSLLCAMDKLAEQFGDLLENAQKEEDLQKFIKTNEIILHPYARLIPKHKLGSDFVTDFIMVLRNEQGLTYILVELESVTHSVLNRDGLLSAQANHAIKQTRDWDIWLEKHRAYIQDKLPGFETPKYLIVIGRSNNLDDKAKAYLRSYNRNYQNTEILTYDDLLVQYREFISRLRSMDAARDA